MQRSCLKKASPRFGARAMSDLRTRKAAGYATQKVHKLTTLVKRAPAFLLVVCDEPA
jgi:hypothetical protein